MLFKTPIHIFICKVAKDAKHLFCYLDFRCYFEANGQNHIHFRLIQVLKNSNIAWHFLTFTSPSSKLEFVYPPCCGVKEQMHAHLLVKFNACLSQRLVNCDPVPKLTIVLIWRTPAFFKFGRTPNHAVENLPQRKQRTMHVLTHPPNFLVFLFELFVAQWILVKGSAVHSG